MEIELTSTKDTDTFTWRAAGARQPRGTVAVTLLPGGSKVGDVLRVEAEVEIDGITILSVLPPKEKAAVPGRIEVIGPPRPAPGVTTVLAERRGGRGPRDRDDLLGGNRRPRREAGDRMRPGDNRTRRDGPGEPRGDESGRERHDGVGGLDRRPAGAGERRPAGAGERRPAATGDRPGAAGRPGGTDRGGRGAPRPARSDAPQSRSSNGPPGEGSGRPGSDRGAPGGPRRTGAGEQRPPIRRGPHRLEPGTKHRDALIATLSPEHRPIAERLALGGLPAVRKAVGDEQERAKAEGRPTLSGDLILALAEQLLPDIRAAVWLDKAEAAAEHLDELGLRDLRATVAAAEPRTEETRQLQRLLKEGLERRVTKLREGWEEHLRQALDDGRVLQALRLSARPPEPTARFPGALVEQLATLTGAAMTAETSPERWLALLEAAVASPVRRQVKPAGIPADPTGEVANHARLAAGRIPALAPLLGMSMPPPPKPLPGERPAPRRMRLPRPPKPARAAQPTEAAAGSVASADGASPSLPEPEALEAAPAPEAAPVEAAGSDPAAPEAAGPDAGAPEAAAPEVVPVTAIPTETSAQEEALPDAAASSAPVESRDDLTDLAAVVTNGTEHVAVEEPAAEPAEQG
jgi:hypothetical protein